MIRTYVFSVEVIRDKDGNALAKPDSRIHIYENVSIEKALDDLQNELWGGYKILDMYSEPQSQLTETSQSLDWAN